MIVALSSAAAQAKEKGVAIAAVAIPADGGSAAVSVNVARIAKDAFGKDADVTLLDLEKVMEGADPVWIDKLVIAEAAVKKGKTAKDSVELPIAADAFAEAMVAYEQAIPGLKDMSAVVDTLVNQGTIFVLQGDLRSAQQSFLRALTLDPAFRLSKEAAVNSRVQKTFDAAVKEQRAGGQGTLTVYASTGAAEVWVDGVFRGVAPFTVDTSAGRHYVRVVRDGYLSWGTSAEVRRGSEASVNANMRPTGKLAKLEELSGRITREPEDGKPVADLAAALQVDRLVCIVVKDENGSASLIATEVDGVSGKVLAKGRKVFASKDSFFDHDVQTFLDDKIKNAESGGSEEYVPVEPKGGKNGKNASLLPGNPDKVETPGAVVGGWVLVGTGSALAVNTVVCGIVSYVLYDTYRNRIPTQLDGRLNDVRNTWLTMSIVTDASWVLGGAAIAGGTVALINGYAEQSAQEEVLNP